jgi:hypothetical protein
MFISGPGYPESPELCCRWPDASYLMLGGRQNLVMASFVVRNGIVWGKGFDIQLDTPDGYFLEGSADFVSRFRFSSAGPFWHPEYEIGTPGACHGCKHIYARFTAFADPAFVRQTLDDFNLDCLTRYHLCATEADIMPKTWKALGRERARGFPDEAWEHCSFPMEMVGRDSFSVAIAVVASARSTMEYSEPRKLATFHIEKWLKSSPDDFATRSIESDVASGVIFASGDDQLKIVVPGSRFILGFDEPINRNLDASSSISPCGIIPLNEQNLAAVQRGVWKDVLLDDSRVWP